MKNIAVILFLSFNFIFVGFGALIYPEINNLIHYIGFLVISAITIYAMPWNNLVRDKNQSIIKFPKRILIFPVLYALCFILHDIPMLQDNVEISRVEFSNEIGMLDRILSAGMLLYAAVINFARKKYEIIYLLFGMFIVYCTGFRSKVLDFILIYLLSKVITSSSKLSFRGLATFFLLLSSVLYFTVYQTALRFNLEMEQALLAFTDRLFAMNWIENVSRANKFIESNNIILGSGYINDFLSVFSSEYSSVQEIVTSAFNSNEMFVMTLTSYGETIINWREYSLLLIPLVILVYFYLGILPLLFSLRFKGLSSLRNSVLLVFVYMFNRYSTTGGYSNLWITSLIPLLLAVLFIWIFSFGTNSKDSSRDLSGYKSK